MVWMLYAFRNCGRRRLRTAVTASGVAIAIAALFSLISFQRGYRAGLNSEIDHLGAHILVVPKGCPYNAASIALHGASWPCFLKDSYLTEVQSQPGVATAAPVFMNAVYDASDQQYVYLGANREILALKRDWHIDGRFPERSGDCLVGSTTASQMHWSVGQRIALPAMSGATGTVAGIISPTHGEDDRFIYMGLADAQKLFHKPHQLTHILVRLSDPNMMDSVVAGLHSCGAGLDMNVVPLTHLFRSIQGLVNSTRALLGCVALVALLVAGAGVSNTVLMAVNERTREIGVLRAVGASRSDVFGIVWLETLQVCIAGALVGLALAIAGANGIEQWLRARLPFAPTDALVRPEFAVAAACIGAAAALGSLAGLLPAWRASSLSPVEAIRTGANG